MNEPTPRADGFRFQDGMALACVLAGLPFLAVPARPAVAQAFTHSQEPA